MWGRGWAATAPSCTEFWPRQRPQSCCRSSITIKAGLLQVSKAGVWRCPAAAGPAAPPAAAASAAEAATAAEEDTAEAGTVAVPPLAAASSNGAPSMLQIHVLQTNRRGWHATVAFANTASTFGGLPKARLCLRSRPVRHQGPSLSSLSWSSSPVGGSPAAAAASWLPADGPCTWHTPCSAPSTARCIAVEAAAIVGVGASRCGALNLLASWQHPSRPSELEELHG